MKAVPVGMMSKILFSILAAILIAAAPAAYGQARDAVEEARIQCLIKSVEGLQGVKFVRNGREYGAAEAAGHLRLKLNKAGPRVRTADDFITLCGSKSYLSGEPYLMRFTDGTAISAESFFRRRLKECK